MLNADVTSAEEGAGDARGKEDRRLGGRKGSYCK